MRMPEASNRKVLTSNSAPCAGISWPFHTKVTPAALPMRAMIWRVARKEVWTGAMRVSWLTGCPSAVTAIHEVSLARITRVMGAAAGVAAGVEGAVVTGAGVAAAGVASGRVRGMTSFPGEAEGGFTGVVATKFAVIVGEVDGAGCGGRDCGAVAGALVDEFVGDIFAGDDFADVGFAGAGFAAVTAVARTGADCAVGTGFGGDEAAWGRAPRE